MGHTIPSRDIGLDKKQDFRERILRSAVSLGEQFGLWSQGKYRYRDLGPEDVELTDWATPLLRKGCYTPWTNFTISQNQVIVIYKVLQLSENPTATTLRFSTGAVKNIIGIQELEACYSGLPTLKNLRKLLMSREGKEALNRLAGREDPVSPELLGVPMEAYFSDPYMLTPLHTYSIEVKARKDSTGDYLVLGGFVLEPAGLTMI